MGSKKKIKTPLNDELVQKLLDAGLTKRIIANYIKKGSCYEDILPKIKGKVEEIEAREWLKVKMWEYWPEKDDADMKKNRENFKIPKKILPKVEKDWCPTDRSQYLSLTFPMLPSVNHMYQTSKANGARQLTMAAKKLFIQMQEYVESEVAKQSWEATYKTKVVSNLWFYFPDLQVKDNHNMFKFLFDVMDGIVLDNDYYILPRVQELDVDKANPRIEVKLSLAV